MRKKKEKGEGLKGKGKMESVKKQQEYADILTF